MHFSRSLPFFIFLGAACVRAQTATPPSANDPEKVVHLDAVIISSGPDAKTAFDLAQGTSILTGEELHHRSQTTLGETLSETAGVNSTYYGPGASRPIIRGLGGDRIRVLSNGVGALDASNISPDHNTAVEPLFASRIEVLRGPSTLLYGSSAVGGVVNVIDNAIPSAPPTSSVTGAIEMRGFGAADERAAVGAVTVGDRHFALQFDGLDQQSGDVGIPGVARIDPAAPANQPNGTLPNSDITTRSGSIGGTWFGSAGHIGAAVSSYFTDYGVPVDEPISIAMHQRRLDLQGETTTEFGIFRGVRARFGLGDYTHSEIFDHTTINTTFVNKAWEGRVELPHALTPDITGTFGVQGARSDFSAVGDEVVTPPSVTGTQAIFGVEEWKRGQWSLQAGARLEHQSVALGDVDPSLPALSGYAATSGERKADTGVSGSVGTVFYPDPNWSLAVNLAYTERLPTAQERFSNGPHGGTNAYEVGTSTLGKEKSVGFDISLRHRAGFVTGTISAFANRFQDYIYEEELPLAAIPAANNPEGLTPYQFIAKDALFYGAEAEVTLHLLEEEKRTLHMDFTSDYVHAEQTSDHTPLPRIPPFRFGAALRYEQGRWRVGIEERLVARQDRVAANETPTPGYALLNADVAYQFPGDRSSWEIFARGSNLANQDARVHTSFLKDFAPLPGRGILAGVRWLF